MTEATGLSGIYEALDDICPETAVRQMKVSLIESAARLYIEEHREQVNGILHQLESVARENGEMRTMIAVRLFLEIRKYHLRKEQFLAEFDEAFSEVARDLAPIFYGH